MAPPGGAPMAPPGGGPPPGMGGQADPDAMKKANLWFYLSILSFFCGCYFPLGIVPTYMSYSAKKLLEEGDAEGAQSKLKIAKICVILGWVLCVLYALAFAVFLVFGGGLAMITAMF